VIVVVVDIFWFFTYCLLFVCMVWNVACMVVCELICIVSMYVGAFVMILFDDALCLFKLVE